MKNREASRGLAAPLALAALLLAAPLAAPAAGEEKQIPPRLIPPKEIPGEVRYRQAPALDARQAKNRRLVNEARGERRELHRGGTAYEMELR